MEWNISSYLACINGGDLTAGGSAAVASEAAATYFTNQYKDNKDYQDANGVSKFAKDLNDPKKLFIAAWFLLKGDEAFSVIHDHYKKQIENARKDPGQANAKPQSSQATSKGGKNRVVVKNNDQKTTRNHKTNNMIKHDFFD